MDWIPVWPMAASEHAVRLDSFVVVLHAVIITAFIGWFVWYAVALFRFREKRHPQPDREGLRSRLPFVAVAIVALVEFGLLVGLSVPYWHDQIAAVPLDDPDAFRVRVVGQQFQWNVHYPGPDGVFGRTDAALVDDQTNLLGLDPDDPAGEDDITTLNILYLPVGRQAIVELGTKDVIHSFFLPEFRIKQDAIPGMRIPVYFRPTMTTAQLRERTGSDTRTFEIACAQLCGINHYQMRGFVYVVEQAEFDAWYAQQLEFENEYDDWDDF
jgi:cytochrome c oxidase subunit II